jgi:hypothetical protein
MIPCGCEFRLTPSGTKVIVSRIARAIPARHTIILRAFRRAVVFTNKTNILWPFNILDSL